MAQSSSLHRVFFALWPDVSLAPSLGQLAREGARAWGGRAMAQETLHLTLAFVGDVDVSRLPDLRRLGAEVAGSTAFPLDFSLDDCGYWQRQHLLWLGCKQTVPTLAGLAGNLGVALEAADFRLEKRDYFPHVTLARRGRRGQERAQEGLSWCDRIRQETLPLAWRAANFSLLQSNPGAAGAAYATLDSWPLGEARP